MTETPIKDRRILNTPRAAKENPMTAANRRTFLKTSAAASAAAGLAYMPTFAHAASDNPILKVGLIGCGSRGGGAARQALMADRDVKLWAVGDAFRDRTKSCLTS